MKKFACYFIYTLLLSAIVCACNDNIDIKQDYEFSISHLPVVSKIKKGETAEIRCKIVREGRYDETEYFIRYFQPDGIGELRLDDGTVLLPNDTYPLSKEEFRIYYTSMSEEQHTIDLYFSDNMGNEFKLNFKFNNTSGTEEEELV